MCSKNSKKSSRSTLQDMMLKYAVTKASLLAEASTLEECQNIAHEELRLSQRKKRLALDMKLAKIEAEEKVYTGFTMATRSQDEVYGELSRDVGSKNTCQQIRSGLSKNKNMEFGLQVQRKPTKTGIIGEQTFKQFSEFCYPHQEHQSNPHAPPWKSPLQQDSTDETGAKPTVNGEDYLETMKKLTVAALLPKSKISMFDGNPLKYFLFIRSFQNNVENDTCDFSKRLQLIVQFCTGKARRAIEGCILLQPQDGYLKAKQILAERFGDAYTVSDLWLKKVSCGPVIKPGDREGLQELADDLENCEMTLKAAGRLTQLNNEDRLVKILERCPNFVKSRWQSRVQEIRSYHREPTVEDVRCLIRTISKEKNDPVFGANMDNVNREHSSRNDKNRRSNATYPQLELQYSDL